MSKQQGVLSMFSGATAPVMDLDYDLFCAFHTPEILRKKVELLAEAGFKRLYIVAPPPGQPDYSIRILPAQGPPNFLRQSRAALGDDPLTMVCEYAREVGLEIWITMKPYEGGGGRTIPHGMVPPCGRNWMEVLGGRAVGMDPFLIKNQDCLIQRKPYEILRERTVTRIELVFLENDGAEQRQYPSSSDISIIHEGVVRVFESVDNGAYQPCEGAFFAVRECFESRMIRNANGDPVFDEPMPCRVVVLTGLEIDAPYFAVQINADEEALRTIPFSMFTAFSGEIELPVTVSPTVRDGALTGKTCFDDNGFEFEEMGPYYWDDGWKNVSIFGFARGRVERIRSGLCEAYPAVTKHWMQLIRRYIDLGCAGIEFRLQNHGAGVTDFINYGFNLPLVQAYREKYGVDILQETVDPIKMMRLRGNFFERFLCDAADVLHQHGCRVQVQLNSCFENPTTEVVFDKAGFWAMPKVLPDWRRIIGLSDEITIKDYNWGVYDSDKASEIKDLCAAQGKPLWLHCYLQQGHDLNSEFIKGAEDDPRVTGLMLYEVVWNEREGDGIIRVYDDGQVAMMLEPLEKEERREPAFLP